MKPKISRIMIILVCLVVCGWLFSAAGIADDHGKGKGNLEREDQHRVPFLEQDEGNETAGQIAAWLLVGANLTIALAILVRWINRFAPLGPDVKSSLSSFNRFQKKHLMLFHYYLNPAILAIVAWHWLTSRCQSSSLPEWGLAMMGTLMVLGIILKSKLCPIGYRKTIYQIHSHPLCFLGMILVLIIGHTIVD
jgi:hypothetical protein